MWPRHGLEMNRGRISFKLSAKYPVRDAPCNVLMATRMSGKSHVPADTCANVVASRLLCVLLLALKDVPPFALLMRAGEVI